VIEQRRRTIAIRLLFTGYAVAVGLWLLLGILALIARPSIAPVPVGEAAREYAFSLLNFSLGVVLFARRPDDLVPRLLAFALLGTAATFNMPSHRAFYLIGTPWPVQLVHFAIHITSGVCYVWAVVLFPDGSWPRRIRLGRRSTWVIVASWTLAVAVISWRGSFLAHPQFFMVFFGIAVPMLGIGAQTLRLRDDRANAHQRAVARLMCAALLPSLAGGLLWLGGRCLWLLGTPGALTFCARIEDLFPALFAIVPIVLVAGVLRYRLWDIDRLLSRVLLYGALSLAVGGCYVVIVTLASWFGGDGLWSTVIAAAVAVALAEPLRLAARRWANRVVFGQELSPTEATRSLIFGLERLSAGREIDQVAAVALAATRARDAAIWLDDHGSPVRLAHAEPDRPTEFHRHEESWPIRYEGARLGSLTLGLVDGEHLPQADRETAARIADHAGLVLHNAQLTVRLVERVAELSDRTEVLRQTRRRLVAAQDQERYRLERDLHDGAQQALVAAVIGAAALRPPMDDAARDELGEVLQTARHDLDDVLADAPPAALARGLGPALRGAAALAERDGLVVSVDQSGEGTVDSEVEAAVYYCCREALQNVAKHAHARHARVALVLGPEVRFSVADDGTGIDLESVTDGAGGLLQLGSRLAVLGGTLTVENGPGGRGVVVRGSVPAGASEQETP
jgi:signal transduction histidine kinase